MSETTRQDSRSPTDETVDAAELAQELRRQISAVREQMEAHREIMLAAGLTGAALREPSSWAPREDAGSSPRPGVLNS